MRNEKSAYRRADYGLVRLAIALLVCGGISLPGFRVSGVAWAQGTPAIVSAERVFVRRGPGTDFPPFATLSQGDTVDVQEMQGEWARISTASGQVGYVNSNFLALPGEKQRAVAPTAIPTVAAAPTAHAETTQIRTLTEKNKALEAQVRSLHDELTAMRNHAEETPAPAPAASTPGISSADAAVDAQQVQAELKRLATAVEAVQLRLDTHPVVDGLGAQPSAATDASSHVVSPIAVLLGTLGMLVGWMLGSGYGRKQERGRRTRIRF